MNYIYKPKDPAVYAVNLRAVRESRHLEWDIPPGQNTMIVQCPYGERPYEYMNKICDALENYSDDTAVDDFFEVMPNVKIRFISAAEKGRLHGCPISDTSCTYMVFAVNTDENECDIYAPQIQAMTPPYVDIPTEVHVTVEEQTKINRWLFSKKEVLTGFYIIKFDKNTFHNYADGDLVYTVGSLQIPITSKMVSKGTVYVKSIEKPEIKANKSGISLF